MANYSNLKAAIAAAIKTNGNQEITGQVLQDVLTSMVSVIGANYTFAGVATPSTNPGTPDQNVVYFASQAGTYTNFGGIELPAGISLLMWNGAWTVQTFFGLDEEPIAGSDNLTKSGGVAKAISSNSVLTMDINEQPLLLFENVKKGELLYAKLKSNTNNYFVALSTSATAWAIESMVLNTIPENGILFKAYEDYEKLYLRVYGQTTGITGVSVEYGRGQFAELMSMVDDAKIRSPYIENGDSFFGHVSCSPNRYIGGTGLGKSNFNYHLMSPYISVEGYKFIMWKNLADNRNNNCALALFDSSFARVADSSVIIANGEIENSGFVSLDDFPTAKYVVFMPSMESDLLDSSFIRLTKNEDNSNSTIDYEIKESKRYSSDLLAALRSVLNNNKDKYFSEADCTVKEMILKRDGSLIRPAYSGFMTSDFISLEGFSKVRYSNVYPNYSANYTGLHLYDENKNNIAVIGNEGVMTPISGIIDLSDYPTAKYMRFSPGSVSGDIGVTCSVALIASTSVYNNMDLGNLLLNASGVYCTRKVRIKRVTENDVTSFVLTCIDGMFNLATANNRVSQGFMTKSSPLTVEIPNPTGLDALYAAVNIDGSVDGTLVAGDWALVGHTTPINLKRYVPIALFDGDILRWSIEGIDADDNVYVLDATGNGDITTMTQALSLPKNSIVHVRPGRYITNQNWTTFRNGVSFIGDDVEKCVIYNDDNDYYKAIIALSGTWKNITFESLYNTEKPDTNKHPYAVHIDGAHPVDGVRYGVRFENCKFISENNPCLGIGMAKDYKITFNNCDFIYRGRSIQAALLLHNVGSFFPVEEQGSGTIEIIDCRLYNEVSQTVLRFALKTTNGSEADYIMDQYPTKWIIINSSFYSATNGKTCIIANDANGNDYVVTSIPSAVNLDARNYGNNVELLNVNT